MPVVGARSGVDGPSVPPVNGSGHVVPDHHAGRPGSLGRLRLVGERAGAAVDQRDLAGGVDARPVRRDAAQRVGRCDQLGGDAAVGSAGRAGQDVVVDLLAIGDERVGVDARVGEVEPLAARLVARLPQLRLDVARRGVVALLARRAVAVAIGDDLELTAGARRSGPASPPSCSLSLSWSRTFTLLRLGRLRGAIGPSKATPTPRTVAAAIARRPRDALTCRNLSEKWAVPHHPHPDPGSRQVR